MLLWLVGQVGGGAAVLEAVSLMAAPAVAAETVASPADEPVRSPAAPARAVSSTGRWFGGGRLDYWGGKPYGAGPGMVTGELAPWRDEAAEEDLEEAPTPAERIEARGAAPDWEALSDPKNVEFWREGDHVPPAQLMAIVRDPSPENVERYREWQRKKLEVSGWVAQLVAEPDRRPPVDWSSVTVVYFYAMECGVCARNAPVVDELMELGADVMPVHLDRPSPRWPTSTPWREEMAAGVKLVGTPTWVLVKDGNRVTVRGMASRERLEGELR